MLSHSFGSPVSGEDTLERQLEALVEWMQVAPGDQGEGRYEAFFDALRAVLMDADVLGPWGGSTQDEVLLSGFDELERDPPGERELVDRLLRQLAEHGDLQGPRAQRLMVSMDHLLTAHARLFWQEAQQPADVGAPRVGPH